LPEKKIIVRLLASIGDSSIYFVAFLVLSIDLNCPQFFLHAAIAKHRRLKIKEEEKQDGR
jgi:hypothetical protein